MENYDYNDYLHHHGTKGMHWGVRLYQNKDGSLTALGRKRYNKAVEKVEKQKAKIEKKKTVLENRKKTQAEIDKLNQMKKEVSDAKKALKKGTLADQKVPEETIDQRRERILKSVDPKEIYANKDILTTQELKDRISRMDEEAKLAAKIPKEKTTTDKINDALDKLETVSNIAQRVANTKAGKAVLNQLGLGEKEYKFDYDDFIKNISKKSHSEVQDVQKRFENEQKLKGGVELLKKNKAKKEAEEKAAKEAEKKAEKEAKTQAKAEKKAEKESKAQAKAEKKAEQETKTKAEKKKDEDDVFRFEATADDIVGAGSSSKKSYTKSSKSNGEKVVYEYYTDNDWRNSSTSDLPSTYVKRGRSTISGLLTNNTVYLSDLWD